LEQDVDALAVGSLILEAVHLPVKARGTIEVPDRMLKTKGVADFVYEGSN
jgi:hypothetical protein